MKREHTLLKSEPLPPFGENLVFWAPLTEGDLTDHISSVSGSTLGNASISWNPTESAYLMTTNQGASLNYQINTYSIIPESYTVVADVKVAQSTTTFYMISPGTYSNNCYPTIGTHNFGIASDLNNWHRCVSVQNKVQLKRFCYLDSNLHVTYDVVSSNLIWPSNWAGYLSTNLSLGAYYYYNGKAYLKNVRIYNRTFTASEVVQL